MPPLMTFFLILNISCAFIMQLVAREARSQKAIFWFIMGLIFGPLAFIAIPFISRKK